MPSRRLIVRLCCLLGFLGLFCGALGCLSQDDISWQRQAITKGNYAFQKNWEVVALLVGEELRCTGVLIASEAVLTAAHCLGGALEVLVGDELDLSFGGSLVEVEKQVAHPLWVGKDNAPPGVGQANDVGVVLLRKPLNTDPVPLIPPSDANDAISVSSPVTIVGFGAQASGGDTNRKHTAEATITQVGDYELQISKPGEPQACDGDSGGPAYMNGRVIGIVSRRPLNATECDTGAIYTRVDVYEDFIRDNVDLPCGSGSAPACPDGALDSGADSGVEDADLKSSSASTRGYGPRVTSDPKPIRDDGCSVSGDTDSVWLALIGLIVLTRRRRTSPASS